MLYAYIALQSFSSCATCHKHRMRLLIVHLSTAEHKQPVACRSGVCFAMTNCQHFCDILVLIWLQTLCPQNCLQNTDGLICKQTAKHRRSRTHMQKIYLGKAVITGSQGQSQIRCTGGVLSPEEQ